MSKVSQKTIEKIKEQILSELYHQGLNPLFTNQIAHLILRDEEFTKRLLIDLKETGLIKEITKNQTGKYLLKRKRWLLSEKAYIAYKNLLQ